MTERTDDWRNIFTDLTDDSGCYEIDKVNIYKLASHLKALYFKIEELAHGGQTPPAIHLTILSSQPTKP